MNTKKFKFFALTFLGMQSIAFAQTKIITGDNSTVITNGGKASFVTNNYNIKPTITNNHTITNNLTINNNTQTTKNITTAGKIYKINPDNKVLNPANNGQK